MTTQPAPVSQRDEHAAKLLHCIPAKVLASCRDPASGALEKRERPVAIAFVDIEGCTRLCEDLSPDEMNGLIETYFSRFFDAVDAARSWSARTSRHSSRRSAMRSSHAARRN
jgi:class 3 adenylate cyclase